MGLGSNKHLCVGGHNSEHIEPCVHVTFLEEGICEPTDLNNYCPAASTPFLGKVLELSGGHAASSSLGGDGLSSPTSVWIETWV